MKDLVYYYNKTDFTKHELGEVQINFNQSFVIDGTKDSNKINVLSYSNREIEPNTIIKHEATQTWWIVSHDKVERYFGENVIYLHSLQLEGAIELLNARDLTDDGFNANRYTVDTFIKRLFSLSNFEYNINIDYKDNLSQDKIIDFIKTFENYTLLSAIREFLDGFNCSGKLSFTESQVGNDIKITSATLHIVAKTGNANTTILDADELFKDTREIRTMDKNSFGTSVVSNAENVISTKTKTFPSVGGIKAGATNGKKIDYENAILRLPSNIFKVNYVDIFNNHIEVNVYYAEQGGYVNTLFYYDSSSYESCVAVKEKIESFLTNLGYQDPEISLDKLLNYRFRVYYCDNYDATYDNNKGQFISDKTLFTALIPDTTYMQIVITEKSLRDNLHYPAQALYFERSKNTISGFGMFHKGVNGKKIEIKTVNNDDYILFTSDDHTIIIGDTYNGYEPGTTQAIELKNASFSVNYVPMSDLKIKMDNDGDTIDTNMYNQNGKITDSNSLSKLMLSYIKEVESDTITKYGTFYGEYDGSSFNSNLPSVGDIVKIDNDYYIINNISLDFTPNETNDFANKIGYYITAEVSLSKNVATKSLLTNPNTNIRDYGIPQNNNVKRKQLYRDFYELDYTTDINAQDNWFLTLDKVLNLSNSINAYQDHIAVIRCEFDHEVNGNTNYYYQLEATTYMLKKSIYEIVDFNDNNIIGYGYQNLWSGFDISKILSGFDTMEDLYNIPISYVDENGELTGLYLRMATIEQLAEAYNSYLTAQGYVDPYTGEPAISIYNASVFIPQAIYDYLVPTKREFVMEESNYKKDALEVPVFEYSCQIDDTENVRIGDNILDRKADEKAYVYTYFLVSNNELVNDNNFMNYLDQIRVPKVNGQRQVLVLDAVDFITESNGSSTLNIQQPYFLMQLYGNQTYSIDDPTNNTYTNVVDLSTIDKENNSLVVVKHTITNDDIDINIVGELAIDRVVNTLPTITDNTYSNKCVVLNTEDYYYCPKKTYGGELIDTTVHSSAPTAQASSVNKYYVADNDSYYICKLDDNAGTLLNINDQIVSYEALNNPTTINALINKYVAGYETTWQIPSSVSSPYRNLYSFNNNVIPEATVELSASFVPSEVPVNKYMVAWFYSDYRVLYDDTKRNYDSINGTTTGIADSYRVCYKLANASGGTLYSTTKYSTLPSVRAEYAGQYIACLDYATDTFYYSSSYSGRTLTYTIGGNTYTTTQSSCNVELTYNTTAHNESIGSTNGAGFDDNTYYQTSFQSPVNLDTIGLANIEIKATSGNHVNTTDTTATITDISINGYLLTFKYKIIGDGYLGQITARFTIYKKVAATYNNKKVISISGSKNTGTQTYQLGTYDVITNDQEYNTQIVSTPSAYYLFECVGQNAWNNTEIAMSSVSPLTLFRYRDNESNWYWANNQWNNNTTYTYPLMKFTNGRWQEDTANYTGDNYPYRYGSAYYSFNNSTKNWGSYTGSYVKLYANYKNDGSQWAHQDSAQNNDSYYVGESTTDRYAHWYKWNSTNKNYTDAGTNTEVRTYKLYTESLGTLTGTALSGDTNVYGYSGDNYQWNDSTHKWDLHNTYSWQLVGSAIGKNFTYSGVYYYYDNQLLNAGYSVWENQGDVLGAIFTYGNYLVEYDTITHSLVKIGNALPTRTKDLMFVFRNIDDITIENNSFKIFVNHYKLK